MTVEIRRPELQALIQAGARLGAFDSVEGAQLQAPRTAPLSPSRRTPKKRSPKLS